MYKIATLNKISKTGTDLFNNNYKMIDNPDEAMGILVRSASMHEMDFNESLLAIARAGAGVNNIPLQKCTEKGIAVFNTPGANANAVKELALAGLLLSSRDIIDGIDWADTLSEEVSKQVEKGKSQFAGNEIMGKSLGVIGLGNIGIMLANSASALKMKVIGYDPYISLKGAHALSNKINICDTLESLIVKSDYISIHVPSSEDTKSMIGAKEMDLMKDGTKVLNFSRDSVVDEDALIKALESGRISKYVTDFPNEKILNMKNTICIPHLGASTEESEENCAIMAVKQMVDYIENGNIINSVNLPNCNMGVCQSANRIAVLHKNIPAMIGQISNFMAGFNVNISEMTNRSRDDIQYTLLDVDTTVSASDIEKLTEIEGVIFVRLVN